MRVEGGHQAGHGGGAIVFENETKLEFSQQFLSVSISTNKAIYTGEQTIKVRAIMLTTALHPYDGIADLFIIDPDGYVIRKWQSKELNNGVLSGRFILPEYPKVGFWRIRVEAQGQRNEKAIKVEKYYAPKFEVYVRMPTFVFNTDKYIEAMVQAVYPWEKTAKGNIKLRWWAKKIDYSTPMYNDSVLYRQEYAHDINTSNIYDTYHYSHRDRDGNYRAKQSLEDLTHPSRYGFRNPYYNRTFGVHRPIFHNWTYIRTDQREFRQIYQRQDPFLLFMDEINLKMGTLEGIQIRAEAKVHEYFYNNVQRGFCETRIINQTLSLFFVGSKPMVFKPGMPFDAQIAVRYHDQVSLTQEQLEKSTLSIRSYAKLENGASVELPEIKVPPKFEGFGGILDIDRLKHYNQPFGYEAQKNLDDQDNINTINPAAFLTDDEEKNTQFVFGQFAKDRSYDEYRKTGVHRFQLDIPENTKEIKLKAYYTVSQNLFILNIHCISYIKGI